MSYGKRVAVVLLSFGLVLCGLWLTAPIWLTALGNALVRNDAPVKADALVVLAGDSTGSRISKGAELIKAGYVPVVLVSGPYNMYGRNEADLSIDLAVSRGYDRSLFEPCYLTALSTEEEARQWAGELRRRGVRTLLLVTSNFHTARARRTFHNVMPEIDIHVIAAPDKYFQTDAWWKSREGQKTFFFEASKTLAYQVGL